MYGVSMSIINLLKKMFENPVWRHLHENELKESIQKISEYPFQEKDVILSLFGGELIGLTRGATAIDRNENMVTLLGFSDKWIEDQEE